MSVGESFSRDGVTVYVSAGTFSKSFEQSTGQHNIDISGSVVFACDCGNISSIDIVFEDENEVSTPTGWDGGFHLIYWAAWGGPASSVDLSCYIHKIQSININIETNPCSCLSTATSGSCGDHLTWELNGSTLSISGTGAMYDFSSCPGSGPEDPSVCPVAVPWAYYWTSIQNVVIGEGVTTIGKYAFHQHSTINSVSLPSTLTTIKQQAFSSCNNLTSINFPEGLESIGANAFEGCTRLTSLVLPSTLTILEMFAFHYCYNVTSVDLPASLQTIGHYVFQLCDGIQAVTVHWTSLNGVSIGYSPFNGVNTSNIALYTPEGVEIKRMYKQNWPWNGFRIDGVYDIGYNLNGGSVATANPTYYITGDAAFTLTNPTRDGYMFVGWTGSNGDTPEMTVTIPSNATGNKSFIANWVEEEMAVATKADPQNTNDRYSTFYCRWGNFELPDDGTEAYIATLEDDNLMLTKIAENDDIIPANTAVILKSPATTVNLTFNIADPVSFTATNSLLGTDVDITTPSDYCYTLSAVDGVVGFYHYTGATLHAHKAYIQLLGRTSAPRRISFRYDQTTGVENVENNVQSTKIMRDGQIIIIRNGVEYNAAGQRIK